MSDFAEGLGAIAEGALTAGAVQREQDAAGQRAVGPDGHTHESACLNCGTHLVGPHCHQCGQGAHVHRTIGAIFHDLLHGVLHFEGRTWATLPMLAWRPGVLTRRYIDGERARFVSPMAMFLFTVFIMFAVFQIMGIAPPAEVNGLSTKEQLVSVEKELEDQRTDLQNRLAEPDVTDERRERLEARLAEVDADLEGIRNVPALTSDFMMSGIWTGSGWKRLDKGVEKWRKNPGLMLYKLQTTAYKFSWLLIPMSVPAVALLFLWRRRFGLYDHAVFVTYSIAFMSMMGIAATIAGGFGVPSSFLLTLFSTLAVVHIYRHLRGAYELRVYSAVWRTCALIVLVQFIISFFALALVMLGLVG